MLIQIRSRFTGRGILWYLASFGLLWLLELKKYILTETLKLLLIASRSGKPENFFTSSDKSLNYGQLAASVPWVRAEPSSGESIDCSLHTVNCILYTVHCTLLDVYCVLYTVRCTLYTVHCTLYTVHCLPCGKLTATKGGFVWHININHPSYLAPATTRFSTLDNSYLAPISRDPAAPPTGPTYSVWSHSISGQKEECQKGLTSSILKYQPT